MKTRFLALITGLTLQAARADIVALPHPGEKLSATSTVIWSPLFQAAWDKMNARFEGPPVRLDPPNQMMTALDSFGWEPNEVMPEGSWKTWCAPATRDFLNQVNREALAITKEADGPFSLNKESDKSPAFFGLLAREVAFHHPFYRSMKFPMNFMVNQVSHPVQFFGVLGELSADYRNSVRVLTWRPTDGSHAIQIRSKQADESVILYLPPADQDFSTACRWIRTWRMPVEPASNSFGAEDDPFLHGEDQVQIPCLSLESKTNFVAQLGGLRYYRKSMVPWTISRAEQVTRFQLDEKGARVNVMASGQADPFAAPLVSRKFLYNRPFFVFLWRDKAEWPYFGAWIGDESALKPFKAD